MSFSISFKAAEDLENIWLYTVEHWSLVQADRYLTLIFEEIEYLSKNPLSGKDLDYIRKNYRSSKVKSHIIFYKQSKKHSNIEIIRVLHERMDIEGKLLKSF